MKMPEPPLTKVTENYQFHFPNVEDKLDQDEEFLFLQHNGQETKILFHEYDRIFEIPGLYEQVFYKKLKCQSPQVVVNLLEAQLGDTDQTIEDLRVLDLGAGNGMVGEEFANRNAELVVGSDIIPQAKQAVLRDRAGVYDDYYISDFTNLSKKEEEKFQEYRFNTLVTVAALGFGDIPPEAFMGAFDMVENGGWIVFNIRDKFLTSKDDTGFQEAIEALTEEYFEVKDSKQYIHRYNIHGEPLTYKAFVGKKIKDLS